jgi:hypothetical protein
MPVLVALLKEALAKPTYAVTRAVPVRGVVRSAPPPEQAQAASDPARELDARVAQQGEIPGASTPRRRGWHAAIFTGLLGFLVAAVIITVPEVVSGKSVFGGGRDTTLFDSGARRSSSAPTDTTTTPTATETTTVPPGSTITVPPAETVTVPPAETTPTATAPTTTTPAPPATTTVPPATTAVPAQPAPP